MRKALYILGQLEPPDIDWLVDAGKRKRVKGGTRLIRQGEPNDHVFMVIDGHLEVKAKGIQTRLGAGEIVGELSFLDARPPSASVSTVDECLVLEISRSSLQKKLDSDAHFAARFYRALGIFLADRLRSTVSSLGYDSSVSLREDKEYEDELDEELLDDVALAGQRMDWLLKRLRG